MTPEQLLADEFNTLRGRILGLIESWGLPEKQENGCKATFKGLTYDSQARVLESIQDMAQRLEDAEFRLEGLDH